MRQLVLKLILYKYQEYSFVVSARPLFLFSDDGRTLELDSTDVSNGDFNGVEEFCLNSPPQKKVAGTLVAMNKRRPFEETHPHLKEFTAFLNVLNKESERGAVLISATMLDDLLERSIRAFLIEHKDVSRLLDGFSAPLGTFSARALVAFSLGVLSEDEYQECERIRKIRNIFAHNVHASFLDQSLKDLCATLEFSAKDYGDVHVHARGQFTTAATGLILNLTNRPHYASLRRLKYSGWQY